MKNATLVVWCAAAVAAAGCAGAMPAEDPSASIPAASQPDIVIFALHGHGTVIPLFDSRPIEKPYLAQSLAAAAGIRSPRIVNDDRCGAACDLLAVVTCSADAGSGPARVRVTDPRTGREIYADSQSGSGCSGTIDELGRRFGAAFAPGGALYAAALADKRARLAPAEPAEAAPARPEKAAPAAWWQTPPGNGR